MFERLAALYAAGRLTGVQVDVAASKGWITLAQAETIKQSP